MGILSSLIVKADTHYSRTDRGPYVMIWIEDILFPWSTGSAYRPLMFGARRLKIGRKVQTLLGNPTPPPQEPSDASVPRPARARMLISAARTGWIRTHAQLCSCLKTCGHNLYTVIHYYTVLPNLSAMRERSIIGCRDGATECRKLKKINDVLVSLGQIPLFCHWYAVECIKYISGYLD